jgi:hypothetical protein
MKRILPLIAAALFAAHAGAQTSLADDLKALQDEYAKAQEKFYEEARAKADRGEPISMSDAPAKKFLPRGLEIARKAKGTDTGDQAFAWIVPLAYEAGDSAAMSEAFDAMISHNTNSAELRKSMMFIPWGMKPQERAIKTLSKIEHYSTDREMKADAARMRAGFFYNDYSGEGDVPRAKSILNRVVSTYPGTKAATTAKNTIFAMENLGIGMVAPDFTATDQDGTEFKLSDYRGKVVVVGFWGFW